MRALYRTEESLQKVRKVFSYYSSAEEAQEVFNHIDWFSADITNIPALEKAFQNVVSVYHCAAVISFDSSKDAELRKVNIEGTANIVNLSIKNKIQKFCFASSIATLDEKPGEKEINEESSWNKDKDHDMYAITKYGAEMEVWRGSQEGLKVVIVNPGIIIGPGFWDSGSGQIYKEVDDGLKYYIPKVTGFVGVQDVVDAMRQLMKSSIENQQFIVVAENLPFKTVLTQVANVLEKKPPKKRLQPWMVRIGWILEKTLGRLTSKEKRLNKDSSKTLFQDRFYSNEKLKTNLEFSFEPVEKVIRETGMIFKNEVNR